MVQPEFQGQWINGDDLLVGGQVESESLVAGFVHYPRIVLGNDIGVVGRAVGEAHAGPELDSPHQAIVRRFHCERLGRNLTTSRVQTVEVAENQPADHGSFVVH